MQWIGLIAMNMISNAMEVPKVQSKNVHSNLKDD